MRRLTGMRTFYRGLHMVWWMPLIVVSGAAQTLEVAPARVPVDQPVAIRAAGLAPGEHVAIRAVLTDGAGQSWSSQTEFAADAEGNIDTSRLPPVAAMRPIWSMMPAAKNVASYQPPRNLGTQGIDFTLVRQGKEAATTHLDQIALTEGVQRIVVHDGPLRGVFFVPAGTERHRAVLVVGGSNGGVPIRPAVWLASHGYAALALAYFRYEDLPQQLENIPLEYFERALIWMMRRPEVAGDHFAVMGTSRGGELALQLGSMFPNIEAVVAYVPANVRYAGCCRFNGQPAWTWKGHPLAYARPARGGVDPAAEIEVERTGGPILTISGEDDHLWRSWEMAGEVMARLKRHHFAYSFENLKYPHAGHLAGRPGIFPAWHGRIRNPTSGRENDLGGSAAGDAESSIDSMPKVLEFLQAALK